MQSLDKVVPITRENMRVDNNFIGYKVYHFYCSFPNEYLLIANFYFGGDAQRFAIEQSKSYGILAIVYPGDNTIEYFQNGELQTECNPV